MLLASAHLIALEELAAEEAAGHATHSLAEDDSQEHIYRELELQGLALLQPPRAYQLSYAGREALDLMRAMHAENLLPTIDRLEHNWRFLGSDILAALHAATLKKGQVGPVTVDMLRARGFTKQVQDTLEKRQLTCLNRYGEAWRDFAEHHRPRLEIYGDLANAIRHMHPGYAQKPAAQMTAEQLALMEAMNLLAWSIPEGDNYVLTALGQAVYDALRKEGYSPLDVALDEPLLQVLAELADKGSSVLTPEQIASLQLLGYVDADEKLSAAGYAALKAYSLLQKEVPEKTRTFAITEPEVELLTTIDHLVQEHKPTNKEALHRVLVNRMVKRYRALEGRRGRTLQERTPLKRQAVALLEQVKEHDEWFNTNWDLEELLVGLEAFDLLRAEMEGRNMGYRLTFTGQKIVEEQEGNTRDISATAVKALTIAETHLGVPAQWWIEQAREEELIGTGGITASGRFYANLANHCIRRLALTREEAELLEQLPDTEGESCGFGSNSREGLDEEKRNWALEKLEARGFIDRLVDCQMIRTEAGQLLTRAVSGAMHLGHPITPTLVRVLAAIRQVGTLYVKERKVRMQPHQWEEAERLSGLGESEFREMLHVARMGQYVGEATLTEAGLDLLAVQELIDKEYSVAAKRP